jgi:hypothetical protein
MTATVFSWRRHGDNRGDRSALGAFKGHDRQLHYDGVTLHADDSGHCRTLSALRAPDHVRKYFKFSHVD